MRIRDRTDFVGAARFVAREAILFALLTPTERARSARVRSRLIATLFGRASNVLMVALAAGVCGAASWARGGGTVTAAVATCEVMLLCTRCIVILACQREMERGFLIDPETWLVRFGVLAVASSCCWGAMCFVALSGSSDPVLYVLPVLSTVGTAGAVAARNSGVPRLVKAQLACSLLPILAGSLLAEDRGMRLLLLLVPFMAAGLVILVAERNEQLVKLIETQDELARLSQTDPLTQVANRRILDAGLLEARLERRPVALLMIDVDHFKAFNDRHGHPAGDMLLRRLAGVLRGTLRNDDLLARYGGEEFAVLLVDEAADLAFEVAERLRAAVALDCLDPADKTPITVTIGIATAKAAEDYGMLLSDADQALYVGKRSGRNRIIEADPTRVIAA